MTAALAGIAEPGISTAQDKTEAASPKHHGKKRAEDDAQWVRPAQGSEDENLPDGSVGRVSEYRGCDGTFIAAYLRRPKGSGPFPAVVVLHGGGVSPKGAYGMGRTNPLTTAFTAAGWAVLAIDFRQTTIPLARPGGAIPFPTLPPIEWHDGIAATEDARNLSFTDSSRIAVIAGSHGAYVMSHVVSRADIQAGVLCSPAIFDFIELSRAIETGAPAIDHIKDKVAEAEQRYGARLDVVAKNPECYGYETPMTEAAKVRCPILIINGRNDTSSPIAVMETYRDKLHAAGKTVETFFPDDAPHGFYFGNPKPLHPQTDDAIAHAVDFIRRSFARAGRSS
jgi:dipeptidyl aminopeptidase/acylaminoacyl peptidase